MHTISDKAGYKYARLCLADGKSVIVAGNRPKEPVGPRIQQIIDLLQGETATERYYIIFLSTGINIKNHVETAIRIDMRPNEPQELTIVSEQKIKKTSLSRDYESVETLSPKEWRAIVEENATLRKENEWIIKANQELEATISSLRQELDATMEELSEAEGLADENAKPSWQEELMLQLKPLAAPIILGLANKYLGFGAPEQAQPEEPPAPTKPVNFTKFKPKV